MFFGRTVTVDQLTKNMVRIFVPVGKVRLAHWAEERFPAVSRFCLSLSFVIGNAVIKSRSWLKMFYAVMSARHTAPHLPEGAAMCLNVGKMCHASDCCWVPCCAFFFPFAVTPSSNVPFPVITHGRGFLHPLVGFSGVGGGGASTPQKFWFVKNPGKNGAQRLQKNT